MSGLRTEAYLVGSDKKTDTVPLPSKTERSTSLLLFAAHTARTVPVERPPPGLVLREPAGENVGVTSGPYRGRCGDG